MLGQDFHKTRIAIQYSPSKHLTTRLIKEYFNSFLYNSDITTIVTIRIKNEKSWSKEEGKGNEVGSEKEERREGKEEQEREGRWERWATSMGSS